MVQFNSFNIVLATVALNAACTLALPTLEGRTRKCGNGGPKGPVGKPVARPPAPGVAVDAAAPPNGRSLEARGRGGGGARGGSKGPAPKPAPRPPAPKSSKTEKIGVGVDAAGVVVDAAGLVVNANQPPKRRSLEARGRRGRGGPAPKPAPPPPAPKSSKTEKIVVGVNAAGVVVDAAGLIVDANKPPARRSLEARTVWTDPRKVQIGPFGSKPMGPPVTRRSLEARTVWTDPSKVKTGRFGSKPIGPPVSRRSLEARTVWTEPSKVKTGPFGSKPFGPPVTRRDLEEFEDMEAREFWDDLEELD